MPEVSKENKGPPNITAFYRYGNQYTGDVAMEIEVEYTKAVGLLDNSYWTTKNDGSLRYHGYEYVNKKPIGIKAIDTALKTVVPFIQENGPINDSPRTSFHVHRNIMHMTPLRVWGIATLYWLLEPLLFEYCGPDRKGNLFCLRLKDMCGLQNMINQDLKRSEPFIQFSDEHYRYGGLNLSAVPIFGSLEFRGMRGIYDHDTIRRWVTGIDNLCNYNKFETPEELMDYFYKCDRRDFVQAVLGEDLYSQLIKIDLSILDDQLIDVCDIAYSQDWKRWQKKLTPQGRVIKSRRGGRDNPFDEVVAFQTAQRVVRQRAAPRVAEVNPLNFEPIDPPLMVAPNDEPQGMEE